MDKIFFARTVGQGKYVLDGAYGDLIAERYDQAQPMLIKEEHCEVVIPAYRYILEILFSR